MSAIVTARFALPPALLSPNASGKDGTWRERARVRAETRRTAGWIWVEALAAGAVVHRPLWQRASLECVWYGARREDLPDIDNGIARLKVYIDSAIDAGLIVDDRPWNLIAISARMTVDEDDPHIELTFRQEPDEGVVAA